MTNFVQTAARNEKGFTLVELAVVMIIVGLLIGGILKGQEMIANAQVTSTTAQGKAFDAAVSTFRDQWQGLPGDIDGTRLPNCGAVCAQVGNGDNIIEGDPGVANADLSDENGAAWAQVAAADLITGVDQSAATADAPTAGISIPAGSISSSSWQIGSVAQGTQLTAQTAAADPRGGTYLLLDNSLDAISAAAVAALTPSQARRIDVKLDDGSPNTGSVQAMGAVGATDCVDADTAAGVYNEQLPEILCGIYVRIQG